ncbi:Uncharacterised protein [Mycobacteroides abscessus subsp. abscessus]|nr:Uncharacterised protein [Mycobacteroides abscessus subsp. abscessus]
MHHHRDAENRSPEDDAEQPITSPGPDTDPEGTEHEPGMGADSNREATDSEPSPGPDLGQR